MLLESLRHSRSLLHSLRVYRKENILSAFSTGTTDLCVVDECVSE